ncbi:hypothetical protein Ndes2437B_g06630 [Nannochloris sp. 'desiccata']
MGTGTQIDGSSSESLIGPLWQRNEDNTWDRIYCHAQETVLNVLSSDGETQTKSIPLRNCMLREVTFSGICVGHHNAGFILTSHLSRGGSPRAVTDLTGNSVQTILAADNAQDHCSWQKFLAPKCDSASFVTSPDGMQSFTPLSRSIQSSAASTSSASSSSLLAVAAAVGGKKSGSRKSAMPYSFWSSRIAI